MMRWMEHVAGMGDKCVQRFCLKTCKRSFGRPRHRWEDISMDLKELWWV